MIGEMLCAIASILLIAWCCLMWPTRVEAPPGWYVNGVHPDGWFELRPVVGNPNELHPKPIHDPRRVRGFVHCTGGSSPRQDGLKIWCQR